MELGNTEGIGDLGRKAKAVGAEAWLEWLRYSWLLGANFSSQATGVSDHRNFCKIQMVADSHDFTGCY